jgi:hypothetical protein
MIYTLASDSSSFTANGGSGASSVPVPLLYASTVASNTVQVGNTIKVLLGGSINVVAEFSGSTTAADIFFLGISYNGALVTGSQQITESTGSGEPVGFSASCILNVNAGDVVGMFFDDQSASTIGQDTSTLTVTSANGAVGPTGVAGPTGATGRTGAAGPTGPTGPSSGAFLKSSVLTAASGTFTTQPTTQILYIRGVAGGGQGGGVTGAAGAAIGAAGGGGAGGYLEKTITSGVAGNTGYAFVCGSGGVTGTIGTGRVGGNSTFGPVGGVTYTCEGGLGGPGMTASTSASIAIGGNGGATSLNGDIDTNGEQGDPGTAISTSAFISGGGGTSQFSGGGAGINVTGAGQAAPGLGGGGGGAAANSVVNSKPGGSGAPGAWIVIEYN